MNGKKMNPKSNRSLFATAVSFGVVALSVVVGAMSLRADEGDSPVYTLNTSDYKGTNSLYTSGCDIEAGGVTWYVQGNSTMQPWRIGGKSLDNADRTVYTKTPYDQPLSKIELEIGTVSVTLSSVQLTYAPHEDFSDSTTLTAELPSPISNNKLTFAPEGGFPSDSYYKFTFNVTVPGTSNKFLELKTVAFYGGSGESSDDPVVPTYALTIPEVLNATATVTVDGEWVVDPTLINAGAAVVITWTAAVGYTIVSGETEEFEMDCDRTAKSPVVAAATVDVTGVSLDKTTGEMMVGEELTLVATVAPDNATDKTVTWETSDAEVATVADGVVTAVAAGEVTITAKAGEQSASCTITVKGADVDFTITAAEGVTVEWSVDGGATWTAYAPGAKAPAGDIQIRLKEGKFGVKTLNMTLSADNNAFDVSDVEIPKTIPLAKWSDSFDGESAASTKVGGSKISYMGDWQNPQYVEVRDGSDKAVVIADNCSPYKTSLVAAGSDFSFLTVAKMFRSKTKSSVISYFGNQSSGLYLDYNDKKVKLVDRASRRVIAEYADANVERQFHAYLVTFDNETKTVQFFVDGVKIEPKSTDTVGSHPGTGYQLGAIFGGASLVVDDVSTKKGIDIEVDEIAIWDADVGEVAPEIAEKFPVWPEEEGLPALVDVALEPGKNTTVSQIVLNGKVVDGLDEKEREGDTIEVTFAANARYAFADGEDGVRTVTVGDEAVTITGPDADYFIGNVYATGKAFDRFVLENGEVTQLEEGDTIICDAAHYTGYLWGGGPNLSGFAAHLIVFRRDMDFGAGAGIPANGQVEIDFIDLAKNGVYLFGDIGESARVSGKGILYLGYDMGHGDNVCCTINDGVEISANVSFQQPNPNETRMTIRTVTINGAVKITGAVDATYGLFKLADGAELTVAKLDDGKVVTDVAGKKVVYADGRYMLVPIQVEVTPQPEAGSTAKVYQNGVEVTGSPVKVERDSAVDVVFTANAGHCFADFTSVKTNTVTAAEDPTVVVGPTVVAGQSAGETAYAVTKGGVCKIFGTGVATELPTGIDRSSVKSVEVADGVTEIGQRFFKDCRRMNTLRCGKDVVKFGEKAFYLCLSLESIEIANPNFDMDSLANAIVYQAAIDENGNVYTIPRISAEGYEEVLYGKANLTDGEWTRIGPAGSVTMEESGCHFFHIRLEKVAK